MNNKDRRIRKAVAELLHNLSDTENNNHSITEEQIAYYRGIILATCYLLQATYNVDWETAMKRIDEHRPLNSDRVFMLSLPESWKEYFQKKEIDNG